MLYSSLQPTGLLHKPGSIRQGSLQVIEMGCLSCFGGLPVGSVKANTSFLKKIFCLKGRVTEMDHTQILHSLFHS